MLEEVVILGRLRIAKRTVCHWQGKMTLISQLLRWLKHCPYQVLPEQPRSRPPPRHFPHPEHPQQSRAANCATLASISLPRTGAAVQHRGAAPRVNILASAAPGGHSKRSREYNLRDSKHQCLIKSLQATQSVPKDASSQTLSHPRATLEHKQI